MAIWWAASFRRTDHPHQDRGDGEQPGLEGDASADGEAHADKRAKRAEMGSPKLENAEVGVGDSDVEEHRGGHERVDDGRGVARSDQAQLREAPAAEHQSVVGHHVDPQASHGHHQNGASVGDPLEEAPQGENEQGGSEAPRHRLEVGGAERRRLGCLPQQKQERLCVGEQRDARQRQGQSEPHALARDPCHAGPVSGAVGLGDGRSHGEEDTAADHQREQEHHAAESDPGEGFPAESAHHEGVDEGESGLGQLGEDQWNRKPNQSQDLRTHVRHGNRAYTARPARGDRTATGRSRRGKAAARGCAAAVSERDAPGNRRQRARRPARP